MAHKRMAVPPPSPLRRLSRRGLSAIAFASTLCASAGGAGASTSPALAFKVITRNQDELGVWHVTALLPQLVAREGKTAMATGSVLARVDCRQHVLRIDAWSLRAPAPEDADGWRAPSDPQGQALFDAVCDASPNLRERVHALGSQPPSASPSPSPKAAPGERLIKGRSSPRRFAAQIGLFPSKGAADAALARATSRLPDASDLTPLTVLAPGTTATFKALLATRTIEAARDVCTAQRRTSTRSTCWVRPLSP